MHVQNLKIVLDHIIQLLNCGTQYMHYLLNGTFIMECRETRVVSGPNFSSCWIGGQRFLIYCDGRARKVVEKEQFLNASNSISLSQNSILL